MGTRAKLPTEARIQVTQAGTGRAEWVSDTPPPGQSWFKRSWVKLPVGSNIQVTPANTGRAGWVSDTPPPGQSWFTGSLAATPLLPKRASIQAPQERAGQSGRALDSPPRWSPGPPAACPLCTLGGPGQSRFTGSLQASTVSPILQRRSCAQFPQALRSGAAGGVPLPSHISPPAPPLAPDRPQPGPSWSRGSRETVL